MRNRPELTTEELVISCGTKLAVANIFVGLMFGTMAWVPVSLVYAGLQLGFSGLPSRGEGIALTGGLSVGVGVLWAIVAAERFRDITFRFNNQSLKVYRDSVLRNQILWEDVVTVKQGAPIVIQTKQGQRVVIPSALILSERYDNRALKNQLDKLQKPIETPSPRRFAWIGGLTMAIGVPLFALSKNPQEVFSSADGAPASVWYQAAPSILGAASIVTGLMYLVMCVAILSSRKKPHPYEVTKDGVLNGKRLIRWTDVEHLSCFGSEDMQFQIRMLNGSPHLIDCQLFTDGIELRDSLLDLAPAHVRSGTTSGQSIQAGQILTASTWATVRGAIVVLAGLAVLSLGLAITAATGKLALHEPSDALLFETLGLLMFFLLTPLGLLVCYRVELNSTEIRLKRPLLPNRQIEFGEIEVIEIRSNRGKNGPVDLMTIRAKNCSISFSSHLDRYDEVRDWVLERNPHARIRFS